MKKLLCLLLCIALCFTFVLALGSCNDDETPEEETPSDETPGDETPGDETPGDETPDAPSTPTINGGEESNDKNALPIQPFN